MRVLGITSIRSDYDLMSSLYSKLSLDEDVDFRLLVCGAHLSKRYGYNYDNIKKDGIRVLGTVENLIDSDSLSSRVKSASILMQNSIDLIAGFAPDLIMYAGDREDVLVMATIGAFLRIPTAHFFGGDHTQDGHVDNPVRHAISKLSSIHFVSTYRHADRLKAIGESSRRIYPVGSIALDRFIAHKALSREQLRKTFPQMKNWDKYALLIYHPIFGEKLDPGKCYENILKSLCDAGIPAFVGYPNTDPGNFKIITITEQYSACSNFIFYKSLERDLFLSVFKHASFIIGNSSAGILESASIPIPGINVGQRQLGRDTSGNVLFCECDQESISVAINQSLSEKFLEIVKKAQNIYGKGDSVDRCISILKSLDLISFIEKKEDPLYE